MDTQFVVYCSAIGLALAAVAYLAGRLVWRTFVEPSKEDLSREIEQAGRHWRSSTWRPLLPIVKRLSVFFRGREDTAMSRAIRRQLTVIGNPLKLTHADFLALCAMTGIAAAAVAGLLAFAISYLGSMTLAFPLGFAFFGAVAGFFIPMYYLYSDSSEKVRFINKDLPYALDLMLLMIDAGATFQEAFRAVAEEGSYGPLGEELRLVSREVEHGSTLADALTNLSARIPSDDLIIIVQAINQGLAMGTPLSNIFRDQSDLLRLKRSQRAEKIAKRAGSMMIFPIILIMMATFILILGPAVIQMTQGGLG
jgi:tight adherence protein C